MLLQLEWGAGKGRGLLVCIGHNGAGIHRSRFALFRADCSFCCGVDGKRVVGFGG